ncbi:MAG: hypothetical protein OEY67_00510 [Gammaproteobacteria bacterium]|nr:hypothetical protein [Gammaproteobacteria bacterium]
MTKINILFFSLVGLLLSACAGVKTFPSTVRAGDTVVVAAGWKHHFAANNITVTITPSVGVPVVYSPGSPAIRGVINLYPDPVSSIIVSQQISQDLTNSAQVYAQLVSSNFTGNDKDWWQTTVYVDLPATLPVGTANIEISNPQGEVASSDVLVVDGVGSPEDFEAELSGPLTQNQLASLARVNSYEVNFSGSVVPYAIQVKLQHTSVFAHVVNPRGDIKNVAWRDNAGVADIIITPAKLQALSNLDEFKIYVVADQGFQIPDSLSILSIEAFDINGNPIPGINATLDYRKGVNWIG